MPNGQLMVCLCKDCPGGTGAWASKRYLHSRMCKSRHTGSYQTLLNESEAPQVSTEKSTVRIRQVKIQAQKFVPLYTKMTQHMVKPTARALLRKRLSVEWHPPHRNKNTLSSTAAMVEVSAYAFIRLARGL